MLHVQPNSRFSVEPQVQEHSKRGLGMLIGILLSLIIVGTVGYFAGSAITSSNDAYAHSHDSLFLPFLVSGNVSIGSLGIPRGMTFDDNGNIQSSMVLSVNGSYHYQVYLYHFRTYTVTIFYQDSQSNWQQCPSKPGTFGPPGPETQNFSC